MSAAYTRTVNRRRNGDEAILLSSPHLGDKPTLVKSRRSGEEGLRSETCEKRHGLQLVDVQSRPFRPAHWAEDR